MLINTSQWMTCQINVEYVVLLSMLFSLKKRQEVLSHNACSSNQVLHQFILDNKKNNTGFLLWVSTYCLNCSFENQTRGRTNFAVSGFDESKTPYVFLRAWAGGILRMLLSDWFRERAVCYNLDHVHRILTSLVYFASDDAKVWVKSLLTQWRAMNFCDTKLLTSVFTRRAFPLLFVWQPWTSESLKFISLSSLADLRMSISCTLYAICIIPNF